MKAAFRYASDPPDISTHDLVIGRAAKQSRQRCAPLIVSSHSHLAATNATAGDQSFCRSGTFRKSLRQGVARGSEHAAFGNQPGHQPRWRHVKAVIRYRRARRGNAHGFDTPVGGAAGQGRDLLGASFLAVEFPRIPEARAKSMGGDGCATKKGTFLSRAASAFR